MYLHHFLVMHKISVDNIYFIPANTTVFAAGGVAV
jgi:hypothetical protein